jgi:hypothetical protein
MAESRTFPQRTCVWVGKAAVKAPVDSYPDTAVSGP